MSKTKLIRRVLGGIFLLGAVVMFALGETNPNAAASYLTFLIYWLGCCLLALLAVATAILDLLAVRREARQLQRELVETTLHEIQSEKQRRHSRPAGKADLKD